MSAADIERQPTEPDSREKFIARKVAEAEAMFPWGEDCEECAAERALIARAESTP